MLNGKWHFFLKKSLFSAKKCRFLILTKNPKTNTTLLLPKNVNLQNLKSDCQYLTRRSTKWHFSGTFWPKMAVFETGPLSLNHSFFLIFDGENNHMSSWSFVILAVFGHFWPENAVFWFWQKIQKLTPLYYTQKI